MIQIAYKFIISKTNSTVVFRLISDIHFGPSFWLLVHISIDILRQGFNLYTKNTSIIMPPTQLSPTTTFPNTQTSGLCGLLDVPQSPDEETSFAGTSSQSLYSPFPYFYSNPMDTATLIGVRSFIDYSVLSFYFPFFKNW